MEHPQWKEEIQHLAQTLSDVRDELSKCERSLGIVNGEDRVLMVEDDGSSDAVVQQQLMRITLENLHQLRLSVRSPYFARLDFTPAPGTPAMAGMRPGVNAPVYIGRWGVLKTPEYRVCVHDWRSPVANLYYSGQVGRVDYEAPDGTVEGEMTLKRMFTIDDGELTGMQDTGVVGQEKFLADALSQVTTARLREVVTTIQAEQNTVIRHDPFSPLCVQGAAGSGKTTIALHRVAWMLYKLRRTLRPQEVLILAPNPLFLSYISRVLPDLGVEEVHQLTFEALCKRLLGKRMPKLASSDRLAQRLESTKAQRDSLDNLLRRKGSLALFEEITQFLSRMEASCVPRVNVKLGERVLASMTEVEGWFLKDFRYFPLHIRMQKTCAVVKGRVAQAMEELRGRVERMTQERLTQLRSALPDGPERRQRAARLLDARDERFAQIAAREKELMKSYTDLWPQMDLLAVYGAFWQEKAAREAACAPVWESLQPLLAKKRAEAADLPALLLLARGLYGLERMTYRHIVIDEAQDVAPLQVKVLRLLAGHDAFTLAGDLCQGIYGDEGLRSWEELSEGIFDTPPVVAQLSTSYRSTVEIMHTAFSVIQRHPVRGVQQGRPVLRHGQPPAFLPVGSAEERVETLLSQIGRWQAEGFFSIAVVVKTAKAARALQRQLPGARLVLSGDESFEGGVQVMDAGVVKGLEFDCVIIADAQHGVYPDERFYAKLFYVLCTRPLHRLAFVYEGEKTRHLC